MTEAPSTKSAETKKTESKAKSTEAKGVKLYNSDGREKTVTDPGVVVDLEFNGWSQTKPEPKK